MKKFLSVMLLVFGIIFGNQFVAVEEVFAADVYAYSEGGIEYYVTDSRTLNPFVGAFGASVKGVRGGKVVKYLYFVCNPAPSNGKWVYQIQDQTGGMRRSYVVEEGYLSNSGKAQAVYNIVKSGKLEEANQKELAEKQNKSVNQNSNSKQSLLDKAKSYRDKKDFNNAVEMYNQALKIDPNDKWAYFMLGRTYREMGNPQSAIETFSKIIQMDSNFHAAYAWRGLAYKDIKNIYQYACRLQ